MENKNINIAIIGAGLGGLSLAQGLKKNNISFQIFEKDPAVNSRIQGYRIRINETGQNALTYCLSEELYQIFTDTCAVHSTGVNTLNSQLDILEDHWVDSWSDGEQEKLPDLRANRLTMREVLLSGLDENVHFNKEFVSYEELPDGKVQVHFKDGTSYQADLVVAADGINSRLSMLKFPGQKLEDTGNINVYGKTYYSAIAKEQIAKVLQLGTSVIFEEEMAVIIDAMQFNKSARQAIKQNHHQFNFSHTEDYIYWSFIGNRERFGIKKDQNLMMSKEDIMNCVGEVTKSWASPLQALFTLVEPATLSITPVRTSIPKEKWISNKITVLGDAIHAMSPAGGLGANTALHDAFLLTSCLSEAAGKGTSILEVIADYEEKMRKHSSASILSSNSGGATLYDKE